MRVRQKPIDPCKVAIYIRWSTEDQGEGTTLDVQLEGCRHYVLSQGWALGPDLTFIDDGYSGGNLDRPALTRLRQAIAAGAVDCVVVFKLDRLSRDVADTVRMVMDEWDGRCYVKSAREPIDTTSQSGKMFFYTLASYAEWERSTIRDRTFSGKLRRAQEGRNPGLTPCYGYAAAPGGGFAQVPHEAEVVRRIYRLYQQGLGARAIVTALTAGGMRFRGGRLWSYSAVVRVLANPAYTGDLVYGRTAYDSRRRKKDRAEAPHVCKAGVFPAIISRAEWQQVQAIKASRPGVHNGASGRSHASPHLLTGLACCPCGHALGGKRCGGPRRGTPRCYYDCMGVRLKGRAACPRAGHIDQAVLDGVVVGHLKTLYASRVAREQYVQGLAEGTDRDLSACQAALAAAERALAEVEARRRRVRGLVMGGQLPVEEYKAFLQDIAAEAGAAAAQKGALVQRLQELAAARADQAGLAAAFDQLDKWDELAVPERKTLLRRFIVRVQAFQPRDGTELTCAITWRVPGPAPAPQTVLAVDRRRGARRERG